MLTYDQVAQDVADELGIDPADITTKLGEPCPVFAVTEWLCHRHVRGSDYSSIADHFGYAGNGKNFDKRRRHRALAESLDDTTEHGRVLLALDERYERLYPKPEGWSRARDSKMGQIINSTAIRRVAYNQDRYGRRCRHAVHAEKGGA